MKSSVIKSCTFQREWQSTNGTLYFHHIQLENGDVGDIAAKNINPDNLQPGKELTYTIEQSGEYQGIPKYRIKSISNKPYTGGGGGGKASSPQSQRSMCLAFSKDLAVAGKIEVKDILNMADLFVNWVNQESK